MKATVHLILLSLFLSIASVAFAQIPNQGFETWASIGFPAYLSPNGWGNLNGSTWLGGIGVVTCERGSGGDVHSGTYSMKLTSKTVLGLGDAPGITVTGTINTGNQDLEGGFVYTQRPDYLAGWYKYAPVSGDNGEIRITLWRRNAGIREEVGEGVILPNTTISSFTRFMIPITYSSSNAPDSAQILLVSTNTSNIKIGSMMIVDDLDFVFCLGLSISTSATATTMVGSSDGAVNATVSGGTTPFTYSWDVISATSEDLINVPGGSYCVTVTDANGCSASSCATIAGPDCSGFSVSTVGSDESAPGAGDGAVYANVTGGIPPLSFLWSTGATSPDHPGLTSGNYCVTVTDSVGCTASSCSIVSSPACAGFTITLTGTDPTVVGGADGTVNVTPAGGTAPYSISWDTPNTTGLPAGHYCVTVTDSAFCVDTACITLSDPDCNIFAVTANATDASSATATDGVVSATPINGRAPYAYSWSNLASDSSITNVGPGQYCVTVSDISGCTASDCATVGPDCSGFGVTVVATDMEDYPNGTASSFPIGGATPYSYIWSTGDTAQNLEDLFAGQYCVTVTDANGCTDSECDSVGMQLSVPDLSEAGISIFPNPAQNLITIDVKNQEAFRFRLYDVKGKLVQEEMLSSKTNTVSVSEIPAGNYFVELQQVATGNVFSGKLMKK